MTAWLAWLCGGLGIVAALAWHFAMREVDVAPVQAKRRAGICPHVAQKVPSRKAVAFLSLVLVAAASGAAAGDAFGWFTLGLVMPMLLYLAAVTLVLRQALRQVIALPQPQEAPLPDPCQAYRFPVARFRVYEHAALTMLFLCIALVTRHPFTMGMPLAWALVTWGVGRQMKRLGYMPIISAQEGSE